MGGGNQNQPTQLFQTRVNQSVYGLPYPVVMGTAQVQQNILWLDGFLATQQQSGGKGGSGGGKGGGGKSGGTFYTYTVNCVAALCNGPILGIGDVWSGQSWLGNPTAAETYTIAGGGIYTPTNATALNNDLGVGVQNSYSASYNDYGSPGIVTLSGTDLATMKRVAYGTTLTTGLYSIDPATGNYHFNTSVDTGKTVQLKYSYLLTNINQQENDLIPSGKTITITLTGGATFSSDLGVRDTTTSAAFTKVAVSPTVAGTYQVTGSGAGPVVYHFSTPDIAREVTITYSVTDPNAVGQGQSTQMNFTLNSGTSGQSPFAFLTASYPGAAFGFTSLATVLYQPMGLGASAEIQQNKFEAITADAYGGGIQDCNPVTNITQVLTNGQWGLGVGPIPFPTSVLDNGASGTWGASASTPGARQVSSQAWNWFAANSFFISPVIDSQDTAASVMSKWIEAGMCAAYFSEGLLKLVPYGDTSTAANGVTWTAPQNFIVALDDTTFVGKEGEDPVKISRVSAHDAWNVVQVQWDNRLNQYSPEVTQESDQSLINRWGERREDPQNWDFIHTLTAATFAANMRLKHGSYIRNVYEFTLPYTYSYLEPMDICPISTTSVWAAGLNNANLGVTNLPVRITKIVDDPIAGLHITAEDYPFGAHQPTLYNKQISNGDVVANAFADPGSAEIVMFEATNRLTGYAGDQIWIGAVGTSKNYGFTNVWVSQTPFTTYRQVGTIRAPARMGVLHSTFGKTLSGSPAAYDPDSADSLVVDLVENCQALEAGTTTDADNNVTMCFVDGEIISYSDMTVTGQDQITMGPNGSPPSVGYIRRGQMGSTIASHSAGTLFMRLDDAVFKYTYDPTWRGQTLHFKFQAVNAFGNNAQALSSLTPVSFTLPGVNPGSVDASSGLVFEKALGTNASYRPLSNPLTSIDNGTAPEVDIASFNMQVAGTTVSYNSGSVTGTTGEYGQTAFIYFSDPYLLGGTVAYNLSMTRETALNGNNNFFAGSIQLPNSGGGKTVGNNDGGTGGQYSRSSRVLAATYTASPTGSSGSPPVAYWVKLGNAIDNDTSTYAVGTGSATAQAQLVLSAYPQFTSSFSSNVLTVVDRVTAIAGSAPYLVEYSTNGGGGWNTLRSVTTADSAITTTTVNLNSTVNSGQVQVRFTLPGASGTISVANYAGTGATQAGTYAWVNPTYAQGTGSGSGPTNAGPLPTQGNYANTPYLYLTNYGFSLPSSAIVVGIAVTISRKSNSKSNGTYSRDIYDNAIYLMKAGSVVGTNQANYNDWPTVQGSQSYGGSTFLAGTTWAYTDINNSGFGVAISAALSNDYNSSYINAEAWVYWAQITVYYQAGSDSSCTANIYDASQVVTL